MIKRIAFLLIAVLFAGPVFADERKAIVRDSDGLVVNVVVVPDGWTGAEGQWPVPPGHTAMAPQNAQPGDTWDGTQFVKASPTKPTVITMDAFEARFTETEWNDATDFVYETDTVTGKPKRRALLQGLNRATRENTVDLLSARTDAFMQALVDGGVITSARKDEILTP